MNQKEKDTLSQLVTQEGKDFTAFLNAVREAKAGAGGRRSKVTEAVGTFASKIEKLQAEKVDLSDALADAILEEDENKAGELRGEIAAIEEEIRDIQTNIEMLERHNAAKAEAELVRVAVEQYKAAQASRLRALKKLQAVELALKQEIEQLQNDLTEVVRSESRIRLHCQGSACNPSSDEQELIALYEEAFGAIDVTGHTAGTDTAAKLRFISGNTRGIESTPVAGGKIEHTAEPEVHEPKKEKTVKPKVTVPKEFSEGEMRDIGLHVFGEEGDE